MKKALTTLLIIAASLGFAQKKTITKSELTIGTTLCKQQTVINYDTGDTTDLIYIAFENDRNSYSETKFIDLTTCYKQFEIDLTFAYSEMSTGANMDWQRKFYNIILFDFTDYIMLYDKDLRGYTKLDKRTTSKIIDWLKELK